MAIPTAAFIQLMIKHQPNSTGEFSTPNRVSCVNTLRLAITNSTKILKKRTKNICKKLGNLYTATAAISSKGSPI